MNETPKPPADLPTPAEPADIAAAQPTETEIGGPKEAAPTRYGDWTVKGRCIDF